MNEIFHFLQGEFTHWITKYPLTETWWYNKSIHNLKNITLHTYTHGIYNAKDIFKHQLQFSSNEPDTSHLKNCSAVLTYRYLLQYPWIAVPCDAQYEAFFFCQHITRKVFSGEKILDTSMTAQRTCDDGWFMVNGSNACFSVITAANSNTNTSWTTLSHYDARNMCSDASASVLAVDVASRPYVTELPIALMFAFVKHRRKLGLSQEDHLDVLYGKMLEKHSAGSYLLSILFYATPVSPSNVTFFVDMNGECSVVEMSPFNAILHAHEDAFSPIKGWGVKCRSCAKQIYVPAIICQKESKPYSEGCQNNHFTCNDGTCVLSMYQCDSIFDCWDNSDEENCDMNLCDNCKNHYVSIPCLLGGTCEAGEISTIPTHSICDGIYSNTTLSQERYICYVYQMKHNNLLPLIGNSLLVPNAGSSDKLHIESVYEKETRACSVGEQINTEVEQAHYTYSKSLFALSSTCGSLDEVCKVRSSARQCVSGQIQHACRYFACPGMFKCPNYYCIALSAICDEQYDCVKGEDESVCPLSSCPGLLRCRGEHRCIGRDELCNDHVDCLYSADDEINCQTDRCPMNCKCTGYGVSCNVTNSAMTVLSKDIHMHYFKGVIIKGIQQTLYLNHYIVLRLIYLNVSFCQIEKILFKYIKSWENIFILIADFEQNSLTNLNFLRATIFRRVVYLQLSFNQFSIIRLGKRLLFSNLVVLALRGNHLKEIMISYFKHSDQLKLIDIQYISDSPNFKVMLSLYHQYNVKVSDSALCCLLSEHITCSSNENKVICFGFLKTKISKFSFYTVCLLTISGVLTLVTRQTVHLYDAPLIGKKKYYVIILLNHSGALIMNCLYLGGILAIDIVDVNIYIWRRGFLCMCLNVVLHTSLEVGIVLKTCLVVMVSLQIIYPFKHQCLWLRWTGFFIVIIWIVIFSTYFFNFLPLYGSGQTFKFDSICSIGMCEIKRQVNILLSMTCFLDIVLMILCSVMASTTFFAMAKHQQTTSTLQTTHMRTVSNFKVIFKIVVPIITEFPFRVCLVLLLAHQLINGQFTDFCKFIFVFAMPSNIMLCSSILFRYGKL